MANDPDRHRLMNEAYARYRAGLGDISDSVENIHRKAFIASWMSRNREMKRIRGWLRYIEGNFSDHRECAAKALAGAPLPESFE